MQIRIPENLNEVNKYIIELQTAINSGEKYLYVNETMKMPIEKEYQAMINYRRAKSRVRKQLAI